MMRRMKWELYLKALVERVNDIIGSLGPFLDLVDDLSSNPIHIIDVRNFLLNLLIRCWISASTCPIK